MKNKLLLFLLFFSFLANKVNANNFEQTSNNSKINLRLAVNLMDTIKKANKTLKSAKSTVIIPTPLTTAGSACKEATDLTVKVFMAASGGSGDIIEWFSSQTSNTILHTGSIYSPSVSKTTTYYVRTHAGADFSNRVPVVASVYSVPPAVTLIAFPNDAVICEGTPIEFTASGGGDFFEFSVDRIVKQGMSTNRTFTTNTLKKGQVVSVRTRYGVNFDGFVSETAYGSGALEDNVLSAPLSLNSSDGYINSIKISSTEDKLVFGIAGKLGDNRSVLLFLDTKPGGFNLTNFGDETNVIASAKGFNYFNNNPSTFDSYFQADYCLAISTDNGGTNFFADIIELKTGNSTKIRLGNASTGFPSSVMGVNNGSLGMADYNRGFEVEVLKSLIGYSIGDIKFFAFTMQDDGLLNYNVTNSFLSPELNSSVDYGSGTIDYNIKDPNPVVVSADALIPCYKEASIVISIDEKPTTATVGADQYNCSLTSTSLNGNSPTIGSGKWSLKSGPGIVNFSDVNSGVSTASVDVEGIYVFTWRISNGVCPVSTADVKIEFHVAPLKPTAVNQTVCASSPIQTLTAMASAQAGETVVWYDAITGGNVVADPSLSALGTITYYAESVKNTTPCVSNSRTSVTLTINPKPLVPTSTGDQTVCASTPIQTLSAGATAQTGELVIWYDAATAGNKVTNPILNSLGTVTYYAEAVNNTTSCISTSRVSVTLTLNSAPIVPTSEGNQTVCASSPIQTLTAMASAQAGATVVWYDAAIGGNVVSNPTLNSLGTVTYYAESLKNTTPCISNSRTSVTLTINPRPVVPISRGDQMVCASTPIQTLTAGATAQTGESIVWYDAATAGNVVASPTLSSLGTITYYAESVNDATDCTSTSRVSTTLTLNPTPVVPTSGGNQTVCASSPIQTLTAMASAQTGETVVWYDAATGGNVVSNPTLNSLGTVTYYAESVKNTTPCISSSRTAVTLTINPLPVVPVSGDNQTVCASTPIQTLTAGATAQSGESVVWYDAATAGNKVTNPILNSLGTVTYYAEAVNNATSCISTSRVSVTLTLNSAPIVPKSEGNQTVCASSPIQTLTAMASAQAGETVVWYDAAIGGNVVSNPTLNSLGTVTYHAESVKNTTPCVSSSRTAVTLTINPLPVVPVSGGNQTICATSPIQTLTASATAQSEESLVWYDSATAGNKVTNPTLNSLGTVTYYAEAVNKITACASGSRVAVTLTLNTTPVAPMSGGSQTVCASSPLQTLTATASAQAGETVVWYDAATGGNVVSNPTLNTLGTVAYYAEADSNSTPCMSIARTAVTLTINPLPVVPVSGGNQTVCANTPIQTLTAGATAQSGELIVWYDAVAGGNVVAGPTLSSLGTLTYYAEAVNNVTACASSSRVAVTLTLNQRPVVPTSGGNQTVCTDGTTTQTLTAIATGTIVTWYTAAIGGSLVSNPKQVGAGTVTYYAESSNGLCPSSTRAAVILTIVGVVPNPIANDQTVCSNGTTTQTLTATATGNTITWYTAAVGGIVISSPTQVGVGTATYFAESSVGNCLSAARTKVVISITAVPAIPSATTNKQPTCTNSTGEITFVSQTGAEYSIGNGFQDSPVFINVASGTYTISVRYKNNTACDIKGADLTIRPIPQQIQFEINAECVDKDYVLTAIPLSNSYDPNHIDYEWKDSAGITVGTNSNVFNVSNLIASTSEKEIFPLNYTLTVTSASTGCQTIKGLTVETITCNIQKGISPDGNGANDNFDLRLMDVKKLQIFDRYGIKVYSQSNYTDQWKGQSDKGDDLPSATYYYVIELNEGQSKTGWIYLIREKQ